MAASFGRTLRRLRLQSGVGLRRFAEMIDPEPSNLSALEHGRRNPPSDPENLREIADTLGLVEGSDDWNLFFDAARRAGELPADVQHVAERKLVPALLRTIDNKQLTENDLRQLIQELDRRYIDRKPAAR
jgi:transcriptional regulator with XRE-family HTH domain